MDIIVSISKAKHPEVYKAFSSPAVAKMIVSQTPDTINILEGALMELTKFSALKSEITRIMKDAPQCECCNRKVSDGLFPDFRVTEQGIGGKYLVCNSCRMLVDENFFLLYGLVGEEKTEKVIGLLKGASSVNDSEVA